MSRMSDLVFDLQEAIRDGYLSFHEIARRFEVPYDWVLSVAEEMGEQEYSEE